MRPSPARRPDPRLALRAVVGGTTLLAVGLVGRAQLGDVRPRLAARGGPAASAGGEALGTTSAVGTVIARVDVRPGRVCRGQDVVVEVGLAPGHETSPVSIGGRPGVRRVLRFVETGTQVVAIVVRDPRDGVHVRQLRLKVEECRAGSDPGPALA